MSDRTQKTRKLGALQFANPGFGDPKQTNRAFSQRRTSASPFSVTPCPKHRCVPAFARHSIYACLYGASASRIFSLFDCSAVFCCVFENVQPCVRCGQPCWTKIGRWLIHKACNDKYIKDHRSHPSHNKSASVNSPATHLLAAAAAAVDSTFPENSTYGAHRCTRHIVQHGHTE